MLTGEMYLIGRLAWVMMSELARYPRSALRLVLKELKEAGRMLVIFNQYQNYLGN